MFDKYEEKCLQREALELDEKIKANEAYSISLLFENRVKQYCRKNAAPTHDEIHSFVLIYVLSIKFPAPCGMWTATAIKNHMP